MTKTETLNLLIEPNTKEVIQRIAKKHRVSVAHIVRNYIYDHLPVYLCPKCDSSDIMHEYETRPLEDGLSRCDDCGHIERSEEFYVGGF